MRSEDAITVDGVRKAYRVGVGRARVREMLPPPVDRVIASTFPRWWWKDTFDALQDVDLSVRAGSSVGIVGPNGAGKTTLLKVIAGVTSPTSGRVSVSGRSAALIDVLVGFHPDLTGRENVLLLGGIYGFPRRTMAPRIEQILAFAEIDELADTPVKRYSAGMMARVGFATLTALDVDILLIDEVLAVGDASFQGKCIRWLDGFRQDGGTLLFVSHNLSLVRSMTERVVHLDHGRMVNDGPTDEVLPRYARAMERRDSAQAASRKRDAKKVMQARGLHRWGAGGVRVEEVHLDGPSPSGGLEVTITYESDGLPEAAFLVGFVDESERELGAASSDLVQLGNGPGALRCFIDPVPFRSGIYFPVVAIVDPDGTVRDRWRLDRAVVVEQRPFEPGEAMGPVQIAGVWSAAEDHPGERGETR